MTLQKQKVKKSEPEPKISVRWFRFPYDESANLTRAFEKPKAYAVVGGTGAGKSALIETIAYKYAKRDGCIIDLFGSRDNEGLGWLRSPFKDSVLFLKGNSAEINCECAEVKNAVDLKLSDLDKFKVIISCSAFYSRIEEEWYTITKLMNKLWHRSHWKHPNCLLMREASNLIYARLSLGETQYLAKSYLIYVIREMRHCGFAVALDTIRWYGIDIDIRTIADYTFIKAQGIEGLPASLRFLYRYFRPFGIARTPVHAFAIVSRKAPLGFGTSTLPYWHKLEREDLLEQFDIRIDYRELPHEPQGKMAKVGDYEHLRIVKARMTLKGKKDKTIGMEELAVRLGRSSATVFKHITMHNNMVHAVGECDRCNRVGSEYAKVVID